MLALQMSVVFLLMTLFGTLLFGTLHRTGVSVIMLALQMSVVFMLMTLVGTLLFGTLHLFIDIDVLNNALIFALGGALWTGVSVIVMGLLKKKVEDMDTWNA